MPDPLGHLRFFGTDALGAICNEAMAACLVNIDPATANDYLIEADFLAQNIGRHEPNAEMPPLFLALSDFLAESCSYGACQGEVLLEQACGEDLGDGSEYIDWSDV